MDFSPFKLDLDELLKEFSEGELKTLADMKKLWLERKFSYIFEARPSTGLNIFMQVLYNHSISYMVSTNSLSLRLGALYALYCLYETQPFQPPFKIYLSLDCWQIRRLSVIFTWTWAWNLTLKCSGKCPKNMKELKILLSVVFYSVTLLVARSEAGKVVDIENIKHIAEDKLTIEDEVQKINEEWGNQKEMFSRFIGTNQHPVVTHHERRERQHEQPMLLTATEQQQSDDELQHTGFMELLMGNESLLANGDFQQAPTELDLAPNEEQDFDLGYAKDLEDQLFGDML